MNLSKRAQTGFSLVELLATLGIVMILIGLLLPSLVQSRDRARQAVCASEMRQLGMCIQMYANTSSDLIPFPFQVDTTTSEIVFPNEQRAPLEYFEVAADYWPNPFIDEFPNGWLDRQLICPNDTVSEIYAGLRLGQGNLSHGDGLLGLERGISRSFYLSPSALREDFIPPPLSQNRLAKMSDVAFPSAKALLVESLPFHDDYTLSRSADGAPIISMPNALGHRMVTATDMSVELRSVTDAVPPVIRSTCPPMPDTFPGNLQEYLYIQRNTVTFDYTRNGVLGRDW